MSSGFFYYAVSTTIELRLCYTISFAPLRQQLPHATSLNILYSCLVHIF